MNRKYFVLIVLILLFISMPIGLSYSLAEYKENASDLKDYSIQSLSEELFGDVKIIDSEILYNFDSSPDYIYIEFEDNGYAVFLKETMELMEYSPQGSIKFSDDNSNHYYGGPGSYLIKRGDMFIDELSKEMFSISEDNKKVLSNNIRKNLMSNYNNVKNRLEFNYNSDINNFLDYSTNSTPDYDDDHLCYAYDGTFIPNYQYFWKRPKHGNNTTGTCSAVAAQLLLSYHNYCSDRRIIADKYLCGDSDNYAYLNPNYCDDPMSMTSDTLGTRGYNEDGSDDENSYFTHVLEKIPAHSSTYEAKKGIGKILDERSNELDEKIDYTLTYKTGGFFGSLPVDSDEIKSEINLGRPVYLSNRYY